MQTPTDPTPEPEPKKQIGPGPAPLNYRAPRDDLDAGCGDYPPKPFATRFGVPIGIFYSSIVSYEIGSNDLPMRTTVLACICLLVVPAVATQAIPPLAAFGKGILVAIGVVALLLGVCFVIIK